MGKPQGDVYNGPVAFDISTQTVLTPTYHLKTASSPGESLAWRQEGVFS
ncbi:MAG: hypothetical protein HFG72_04790 [Hungatella sp.]|jgi:hypothetical protein|nr:hypothetical protein [Hungatella sp.]